MSRALLTQFQLIRNKLNIPLKAVKALGAWNLIHNETVTAPAGQTTVYMPVRMNTASGDADGVYLRYPAWLLAFTNTGNATNLGNSMSVIEASLQTSTTSAPVKVANSRTFIIPDGGDLTSDLITPQQLGFANGKIPVGTQLWHKMKFTVPAGGKVLRNLRNLYGQGNVPGLFYDSSVVTTVPSVDALGTSATVPTNATGIESPYGPYLLGTFVDPTTKAFCGIGDSIMAGQADSGFGTTGMGWFNRMLSKFDVPMASINLGVPGSKSGSGLTDPRITALMAFGPDGMAVNFGTNDFGSGETVTVAQALANIEAQIIRYKAAPGVKAGVQVAVAKLLPRTYDASGAYVTDATQQIYDRWDTGGLSDTFNAALVTPRFDIVINQDSVRSATDRHKWTGPTKYALDGTHPNNNGYEILGTNAVAITKPVWMSVAAYTGQSLGMNFTTGTYTQGQPQAASSLVALTSNTRAGTAATYYGTDGLLKTTTANSLRINSKGLLLEKAATNLNPRAHPGLYDTGTPGLTGTPNGAIGVDGTMSAFLTALDTATTQQNVSITADTDPTMLSILIRPETANTGRFYMPNMGMYYESTNAADDTSYYDFSTKTFGAGCNGNWKAEEFTAAGFTWTKLTYLVWNTGNNPLVLLTPKNNVVNRCIIDNVYVGREVYDITPVRASQTRSADSVLIPNNAWKGVASGYLVVDADDSVNVTLTANGITASGWGYIRSIQHFIGTAPANKMAGGLVMMNLSAAGFGASNVTAQWPGTINADYEYPTKAYFDRWKAEGMTGIRLPIEWTRLQKTLNGALDTTEVAAITTCLNIAEANGQRIVIDLHDYYQRWLPNGDGTNTAYLVGTAQVPEAALLDVWSKIVAQWKNHNGLLGWCFMNEPPGTNGAWASTAQKLINQTDTLEAATATPTNYKFINGDGYSGVANWLQQNAKFFPLKGKNLVYEGHFYFDSTNQGLYNDLGEVVPSDRGTSRLAPWIKWLEAYNVAGYIGEVGWPATMTTQTATDAMATAALNAVTLLASKNIPITYFSGGPRWNETHPLTIEYNGVIRGQINQLRAVQKTITKYGPVL